MENINAPDPNEVYGSDAEEFDSEESRDSSFSVLSTPTVLSNDTTEEALSERAAAQSLAATDGSARGSPFSGRSVSSSSTTPNYDESSNPVEQVNWFPHFLSPVHVPVLQEIHTLLSFNAPMSHSGAETISSDEDNDEQRRTWHRLGEERKMKRKRESAGSASNSAKRNCDGPSGSKSKQEEEAAEDEGEEPRVAQCSVCLEEMDEGGDHRLVVLKCGHPFGERCVKKWLETKQCCPLCNRHAKLGDIRVVFLDCCRLGNPYELAEARQEASDLRTANAEQKMALRDLEQQVVMLRAENSRLTDRCRTFEKGLSSSHYAPYSAQSFRKSVFPNFSSFTKVNGQCKYMAYGEQSSLVAVSMKPTNRIFDGFGISLCSLYDLHAPRNCKIIHRQEIKDLCFHPTRPWLLTASLDQTARISDVNDMSLNSVQNLQLSTKVWSCCWSQRRETNFFLGLANGHINEYDVRQSAEPIHVLRGHASTLPIASVKAFEIEMLNTRVSGVLSPQTRNSMRLYKESPQDESGYTAQDILIPGFCFSLFYEKNSASVLVSSRAPNQEVMNGVWKLTLQGNDIVTNCVSTFKSGGSAAVISKPILCQSPSGEAWACCLDDRGKTIQVFSCADGALRHTLETKDPQHVQMTQVERIKIPGRSQFSLLGLSANGYSLYS